MPSATEFIKSIRATLDKLNQEPPRRYCVTLSRAAGISLRRFSWPHKWRGPGRSMRHLRPVHAWIRAVNASINTPEVYTEIDKRLANWMAQGNPPRWTTADVPIDLQDARYVQKISNVTVTDA